MSDKDVDMPTQDGQDSPMNKPLRFLVSLFDDILSFGKGMLAVLGVIVICFVAQMAIGSVAYLLLPPIPNTNRFNVIFYAGYGVIMLTFFGFVLAISVRGFLRYIRSKWTQS